MNSQSAEIFLNFLKEFSFLFTELTLLLLIMSTVVSLILYYLPQEKISKQMTKNKVVSNFLAATLGFITPFCSCSTVPVALGFIKMGIPFSPIIVFVLSSPLLDPIVIVMIATLVSFKAAVIYFVVTFFTSILFGMLLEKLGFEKYIKSVKILGEIEEEVMPNNFKARFYKATQSAFVTYKKVFWFLVLGIGIGAIIHNYIPSQALSNLASSSNFFTVPIAAIIGIPLYLRAEVAIPIGLALVSKGLGLGTIMAMIIGGAGMSIPEIFLLSSIFKRPLIIALIIEVFLIATICGYIFNYYL